MKFEIGKYYRHNNGNMMNVIGGLQTTMYGGCLVGEEIFSTNLKPLGQDEESTINWSEITKDDWLKNFSK